MRGDAKARCVGYNTRCLHIGSSVNSHAARRQVSTLPYANTSTLNDSLGSTRGRILAQKLQEMAGSQKVSQYLHRVRFQVLTAASTKTVFWVVAPCSLIRRLLTFQRCLLPPSSGRSLPDYTALQPGRQPSSYSPP
jgi:hypothetical protein